MTCWSKRFRVKISKMIPCSHELGQIHWPLERRLKSPQAYKWRPSIANYSLIKKSIIHDFNLWFMWVDTCCFQYLHLSTLQDSPVEPTKTNAGTPAKAVRVKALVKIGWRTHPTHGIPKPTSKHIMNHIRLVDCKYIKNICTCTISIYIYIYVFTLNIRKYLRV